MLASAPALNRVIHTLFATLSLFALVLAQSSTEASLRLVISNTLSGPIASDSLATSPISEPTSATTDTASDSTVTTPLTLGMVLYITTAVLVLLVLAATTTMLLYCRRRRNRNRNRSRNLNLNCAVKEKSVKEQPNQTDFPPPSPNPMFDLEDPYRCMEPPSTGLAKVSMSQARNSYLSPESAWDSDATLTPSQATAYLKAREKEEDLGADFDDTPALAHQGGVIVDKYANPMLLPKVEGHQPDDDISIYAISHEGSTLEVNEPHAR